MADGMAIVDTRLDVKVSTFDGADANWFTWCLRFEAYVGLLGWSTYVDTAAIQPGALDMAAFGPNATATAHGMCNLLLSSVEGKALATIRTTPRHNGLECLRLQMTSLSIMCIF